MKKTIHGSRWDTDKAILIGEARHLAQPNLCYFEAGLYQTKRSKRFFLAGKGGPMTAFGVQFPSGFCCFGEKIIPLDKNSAFEWAEQFLDQSVIERFFQD